MVRLRIDNREIEVPENTTVLMAAEKAGIGIPTMCFMEGYSNHPSCMVCLVKDGTSNRVFASCAMPVAEGMEIITEDEEVKEARREAIELLLSDHVGDCEAPCRYGCPAFMDIPEMNRLIAAGRDREALITVREHIALPLILGYICEAPCEKVCRRRPMDGAVSICQLKKYVAAEDLSGDRPWYPPKEDPTGKKVAVIGAGPAGLAAAFYMLRLGHDCLVFDKNDRAGGSLLDLPGSVLPSDILQAEVDYIEKYGVSFTFNYNVDREKLDRELMESFDAVLLATGTPGPSEEAKGIWETDEKGHIAVDDTWYTGGQKVFACGSAVMGKIMAVRAVAHGRSAAGSVNDYLAGKKLKVEGRMFNSRFGKLTEKEHAEYLRESVVRERLDPSQGQLGGFVIEEARKEAERCMHCDCRKPRTCKLRIYADLYGADRRKYLSGERKPVVKQFSEHNIVYEREKCIKCGLCVDIASGEKELTGLTFIGRGFDVRIGIPFSRELDEALTRTAEKCARACPTAAISLIKE